MTAIEIAKELNMNPSTVESIIRSASKKFNKKLKEKLGEDISLYDIIPALSGRGDYNEQMQSL